jgi:sugar lactone lactonase YvrE
MPAIVIAGLVSAAALAAGAAPAAAAPHRVTPAVAGNISTVAGGNGAGQATRRNLAAACGVAIGGSDMYIADFHSVRKLVPQDWLFTAAGTGFSGPFSLGGPATSTSRQQICGVAVDHYGNLVIADPVSGLIEVVAHRTGGRYQQNLTAGHIYRVAGGGQYRRSGTWVTRFQFVGLTNVAVDPAGNLLVSDAHQVWVVAERTGTFYGQAMTDGHVYLLAGDGDPDYSGDGGPATSAALHYPAGMATDPAGNVLIADSSNGRIRMVAEHAGTFYGQTVTAGNIYTVAGGGSGLGDGGPATAAGLTLPPDVAVDGAGNLLIADQQGSRIRVVAASAGTFYGQAMTVGDIYTVAGDGALGFAGDGGPATSAEVFAPDGVAVDGAGNLVIADSGNDRVRVVAKSTGTFYGRAMTAGNIYTVAGKGNGWDSVYGEPATDAQLRGADGLALGSAGDLAIADPAGQRLYVVAGTTGTRYGRAMTAGHIYTVAGIGFYGFTGDGGPAASARLNYPYGAAADGAGNLLVADCGNARIRVVAESTGTFYGQAMTAGRIYTIAGNGTRGFSGDGGPATAAMLACPQAIIPDSAGNLVITASGNNRIRVVAESTGTFYGQAMTTGRIYTVAGNGISGFSGDGGPAVSAEFALAGGAAPDGAGNLVIPDTGNSRIRVVAERTGTFYGQPMTAGDVYTIAGTGTQGFNGDGAPATSTELSFPVGVAFDSAGNLLITDTINARIRVVAKRTGTFYGQPMTAGDVYTIAGTGTAGFSGNGGPAAGAEVAGPAGIITDGAGNILFADDGNGQIRKISG